MLSDGVYSRSRFSALIRNRNAVFMLVNFNLQTTGRGLNSYLVIGIHLSKKKKAKSEVLASGLEMFQPAKLAWGF